MARPPTLDRPATVEQIVQRATRLFSLPSVAAEVLELTDSPKVDVRALARCIENDPALTAKTLKVVNSSLFGLGQHVGDLSQALALLGTKPLKLLVLGFSLPEGLFAGVSRNVLSRYWRNSLTKALSAREIGTTFWSQAGDDAFLAGLLHDIGMLVLLQDLGAPYVVFLEDIHDRGDDLALRQREALGFQHTAVSARLLERWKLPSNIVWAMSVPLETASLRRLSEAQSVLPRILHLAELTTQLVAQNRISVLPKLLEAGRTYCQLTREHLRELVEQLEQKVEQLADVLSLDLPHGRRYFDVLVEAQTRLAAEAESAAVDLLRRRPGRGPGDQPLSASALAVAEALARKVAAEQQGGGPGESIDMMAGDSADPSFAALGDNPSPWCAMPVQSDAQVQFDERLTIMLAECRASRSELSVLMVEAACFADGATQRESLARWLVSLLSGAEMQREWPEGSVVRMGELQWICGLPRCERAQAVRQANNLITRFHRGVDDVQQATVAGAALHIGVATVPVPTRHFQMRKLVEGAERCLYAAQHCEGSAVKSIEVF